MSSRLQDLDFPALLPGSIAEDPALRAAATSLNATLRATALAIPNLLIYARLAGREPAALLPPLARLARARGGLKPLSLEEVEQLAWQFHVDFRETATTREQLAAMVRNAIPWHRIKGTPASIKAALALFGYGVASPPGTAAGRTAGAQRKPRFSQATASAPQDAGPSGIIIEEDGTGRWWATYQLGLPQIADTATVRHIVRICNEMAPARCRLWRIYTDVFDRRPIILSQGPALGDGWLTFYSGAPVPVDPDNPDSEGVLVSFGVRHASQSAPYSSGDVCGSFGATTWYGFLAPYLDRFVVGRSRLSALYPRNHGFALGSLFSILWAERATTGRRWRGEWDARRWLDYTGFDRQLPPWRMERRAISRAQLVPGWGEVVSDHNARLGATFAAVIDNPPRLGAFALSGHDTQRRVLRLHEMFIHASGWQTPAVSPAPRPPLAGAARLSVTCPVPNPARASQARQDTAALRMDARQAPAPREAGHSWLPLLAQSLDPALAPPAGVAAYRAPQWLGAWVEPGRTWRAETLLSVQ
ncbi:phage tail protein [Desulfovibrio sp. ZJ200]|uniref:phage tail protein n=1 Tax=Desulfovibrio sp. ZJ200 TaxID=2709792 RepID=UPI0013EC61AF|nr:phage tail protein [Desulfovibrio sp. ZJ200]